MSPAPGLARVRPAAGPIRSPSSDSRAIRPVVRARPSLVELFEVAIETVDHWRAHGVLPGEAMRAMRRPAPAECGWGPVLEAVVAEQRWMARTGR